MTQAYPTYPDLAGKVVLVTGSSRGIGAETCRAFAANGAKVVVNGRNDNAIGTVVADVQARGGEALGVVADSTRHTDLEAMRAEIEHVFGSVDILAAFAASGNLRPGTLETITEAAWGEGVDGSLTATFLSLKTFLPGMIDRKAGAVLTMATSAARLARPQAPLAYSAAKAGVVMLTRNVASQVARHGVRVNCLAPAMILNERLHALPEAQLQHLAESYPLGRIGQPSDVAQAALFLASEAASWLTGVTLDIAGGDVVL